MIAFERIKKLAKEQHLSLVEVNDRAKLGTRTIYHWKNKQPSVASLTAVANVLHTTTDYLLGRSKDPLLDEDSITWQDLGMPYGGKIPDDLKDYYKALAEQYVKNHPDKFKK